MTTDHSLRVHLAQAPGPRLFLALWGALAVVDVSRAAHLPASAQLALLAILATACAVRQRAGTATAVAVAVWLVMLGFVVNRWGELRLTGPGDLLALAAVVAAALTTAAATR